MAARNFFGEPKFPEGNGGSGSSSSIREWISPNEFWRRFKRQIATSSDRVHRVVNHMYPVTSPIQVRVMIFFFFFYDINLLLLNINIFVVFAGGQQGTKPLLSITRTTIFLIWYHISNTFDRSTGEGKYLNIITHILIYAHTTHACMRHLCSFLLFLQEGMRMGSPCYLSAPLFCSLPPTVERVWVDANGFLHSPGRNV